MLYVSPFPLDRFPSSADPRAAVSSSYSCLSVPVPVPVWLVRLPVPAPYPFLWWLPVSRLEREPYPYRAPGVP